LQAEQNQMTEELRSKAEAASSPHIKCWWYGKALQQLQIPATANEEQRILRDELYGKYAAHLKETEVFLSPGAAEMVVFDQAATLKEVTEDQSEKWKVDEFINLADGTLRWDQFTLQHIMGLYCPPTRVDAPGIENETEKEGAEEKADPDKGKENPAAANNEQLLGNRKEFFVAAKHLQKVSWVIHQWLTSLGTEEFHALYGDKFSILFREQVSSPDPYTSKCLLTSGQSISEIYELLLQGGQRSFLAFSLIASSFERVLADIFCSKTRKEKLCPNKLGELLVHKEIIKILGVEKVS